jgi:UDP-glucose 4-epimerase
VKVLVTGAAGLVGSAIARLAVSRGDDVVRTWHSERPEPLTGARDLRVDLAEPTDVAALPADVDAVIHAAARIPAGEWTDEAAAAVNRRTDEVLLAHYAGAGFTGSWVQVSTVSLEHPGLRDASRYATEKAATEQRAAAAFPGRARSLRISSPYGPGMRHLNVLRRFLDEADAGRTITLLGSGDRTQDFVHADDVAAAALAAADRPGGDPVVIASGAPVSMARLAELVIAVTGSGSPVVRSGHPDPQDGFRADYDLRPAAESLGWAPAIPLEIGLRTMRGAAA